MKTKIFSLFFTMMLCATSAFATTVTFTADDFNGQGTSGTGSKVTASKYGVTFYCDKGFGDQYGVRCYTGSYVTISSSLIITSISFTFNTVSGRTYDGNLSSDISVNSYSWVCDSLTKQARMSTITVQLSDNPGDQIDMPLDINLYTKEGIAKISSNTPNLSIPVSYIAYLKGSYTYLEYCETWITSPSGYVYKLTEPSANSNCFLRTSHLMSYYNTLVGSYYFFDLQSIEAGTWYIKLVQTNAGDWRYYYDVNVDDTIVPGESKYWNMSDAAFNSLDTVYYTTTINDLTIYASTEKYVVVDQGSVREIDGLSFNYRLKFGGAGADYERMLSFPVSGTCDIDIYLISASSTEDRTLNVDANYIGNTLQQLPAPKSDISKGTIHYTGNATTIYLYSPYKGVNIYAIRVTYGGTTDNDLIWNDSSLQGGDKGRLILHNGQILILRGDHTYTLTGQEVQ